MTHTGYNLQDYVTVCRFTEGGESQNMKYSVFYHEVTSEFENFVSAGITVTDANGKEIRRIFDVSTDFDALEEFVTRLNGGNVSLEHLDCMLEDYYTAHC